MNPIYLAIIILLAGCATRVEYKPVPNWLIPVKPLVQKIPSAELTCLSDETYKRLAERDQQCWHYASELRALLGPESPP